MKIKYVDRKVLEAAQEKLRAAESHVRELEREKKIAAAAIKKSSLIRKENERIFYAFTAVPNKEKKAKLVARPKIGPSALGKIQGKSLMMRNLLAGTTKAAILQARKDVKMIDSKDPGF